MRWCDSTPPAQKPFRKDWRPLDPLAISADCVRGREGRWEGGYIHTPRGSQPKLVTTGIYIYIYMDGWMDGRIDGWQNCRLPVGGLAECEPRNAPTSVLNPYLPLSSDSEFYLCNQNYKKNARLDFGFNSV